MNLKLFITGILTAFLSVSAFAKTTLLQGNAFYYRGQELEVHRYLDLFTFKSEVIDSAEIPQDGSFKFSISIEKTGIYLLKIGKVNSHVFLIPGDQYTVIIPEPLPEDEFGPAKDVFVQAEIFEANSRLNYHITKLEQMVNNFFIEATTESFNLRSGGGIRLLADTAMIEIKKEFADVESPFFKTYLHFKMAEFELTTRHSRNSVFNTYFKGQKPAPEHLSFANAFKLFYNGYLDPKNTRPYSDSLESALSRGKYREAMDYLATDKYLQDKDFRELVFATEIYELGRKKKYPLETVVALLDSIESIGSNLEARKIAKNAKKILLKLSPGSLAPDFIFADIVGNLNRLKEYKGQYIYIQFFDGFDAETLRQMSLMKVLKEGYGADIAMFSFSTTESLANLRKVAEKHDFDWFFGKLNDPDQVIENYDLRALPQYFFLDEELKITTYPCPSPGGRIERTFARIWNEQHPNKAMIFRLQPPKIQAEDSLGVQPK